MGLIGQKEFKRSGRWRGDRRENPERQRTLNTFLKSHLETCISVEDLSPQ